MRLEGETDMSMENRSLNSLKLATAIWCSCMLFGVLVPHALPLTEPLRSDTFVAL